MVWVWGLGDVVEGFTLSGAGRCADFGSSRNQTSCTVRKNTKYTWACRAPFFVRLEQSFGYLVQVGKVSVEPNAINLGP